MCPHSQRYRMYVSVSYNSHFSWTIKTEPLCVGLVVVFGGFLIQPYISYPA